MSNSTSVQFNIQVGDDLTHNVKPLLNEIKHGLDNLIETGRTTIIDLRSLPLAPGEEEKILNTLGQGEVQAQLNALGLSEVTETQYAGVWIVTHYNDEQHIISRFIEVTTMPEILCSQTEDVMEASSRLTLDLADNP
ncbi:MAG: hydrogenase accessory protein HupE [Gammaproteobacteria bacterium]|nr:hydrogenase accessory protein HupE [Gammaproteobacteria bacterium]